MSLYVTTKSARAILLETCITLKEVKVTIIEHKPIWWSPVRKNNHKRLTHAYKQWTLTKWWITHLWFISQIYFFSKIRSNDNKKQSRQIEADLYTIEYFTSFAIHNHYSRIQNNYLTHNEYCYRCRQPGHRLYNTEECTTFNNSINILHFRADTNILSNMHMN